MRCRFPGCKERVPAPREDWLRCHEHWHVEGDDVLKYAQQYAVASIVYYRAYQHGPIMTDAEFDGRCLWLLNEKAWKQIPWLEEGMLKAGSGYDLTVFPVDLAEAAEFWR